MDNPPFNPPKNKKELDDLIAKEFGEHFEEVATLVIVARDAMATLKDAGRMTSYFQLKRALEPFEHYPIWRSPIFKWLHGR